MEKQNVRINQLSITLQLWEVERMYTDFYGLSFNPFDKQMIKEKDAFESEDFREMMARLEYLKEIRGIGVFTASPGMGKTFALRCFAKGLNPNLYQCAYLCLSTVSVQEFYRQLCEALGLESGFGKSQMFKSIQERLYYLYKEKSSRLSAFWMKHST